MVDVVVCGVVAGEMLQWIPWELVAAVVVYCLDGGAGEEPHSLAGGHK